MLTAYEQIRSKLASDEVAAITEDAADVQRAATEAIREAPPGIRSHLTAIADVAGRLKEMAKDDLDAVRRTFGDVSQSTVALLAAYPSLSEGRYVFECPMAQGYKKWVQITANISNPYMGQRMPTCGSSTQWRD